MCFGLKDPSRSHKKIGRLFSLSGVLVLLGDHEGKLQTRNGGHHFRSCCLPKGNDFEVINEIYRQALPTVSKFLLC